MKRTFIETFEKELLKESPWSSDDELDLEDSSSYVIVVESNGKTKKNYGISKEDALEEILDFINELTPEEKKNVGLSWYEDDEEWGYEGGDMIVSVYGPSEMEDWPEEDRAEMTIAEWEFAERLIRKALGLPRKSY